MMDDIEFKSKLINEYDSMYKVSLTLNKGDVDDSKDLLQETFLRAWNYRHTFLNSQNAGSVSAWLSVIMRNIKKRWKHPPEIPIDHIQCGLIEEPTCVCHPEISVNNADPGINAIMLFIDGYSYKEISKMQNVPIGTIKSRIHNAKTKLIKLYGKERC